MVDLFKDFSFPCRGVFGFRHAQSVACCYELFAYVGWYEPGFSGHMPCILTLVDTGYHCPFLRVA